MKSDSSKSFLDDALDFCGQRERYHVADALYCHFHNTGQTLAGNTEGSDVEWFARLLWEDCSLVRMVTRFEYAPPDEQDRWQDIARSCLKLMPRIQDRIAHRLIELSKVMQDIERAERRAYKEKEGTK